MNTIKISLTALAVLSAFSITSCKKVEGCMDETAMNFNEEAKKDDGSCFQISKGKQVFVTKQTATWCPPCGDIGADLKAAWHTNEAKSAYLEMHVDDPLSAISDGFLNEFDSQYPSGGGIPSIFMSDSKSNGWSESAFSTEIGQGSSLAPTAAVGFMASVEGSTVTVDTRVEFLSAGSGDYYLSVLLVEDNIAAEGSYAQQSAEAGYKHSGVLRKTSSTNFFGTSISTSPAAGTIIDNTYSLSTSGFDTATNYRIIVLVTKKSGTSYSFVNVNDGQTTSF